MSTIDWSKLTAPVPPEDIEWVEKAAGRKFAYMSAQFVRRRLDSVLPGLWAYNCEPVPFTVGQPPASDGEPFVVIGNIVIATGSGGVQRSSIGSGKNYKEAETDAFKRAAQRLGIGNELYEMGPGQPAAPRAQAPAPKGLTDEDKAVMREAAVTRPALIVKSAPAGDELACPKCSGRMWDNRVGKKNPKSPDWKCRDKACDGLFWKDADGRKEAQPVAAGAPWADTPDDLPF